MKGAQNAVAALPWYDLPSVRWANDALWRATGMPGELTRGVAVETLWRAPNLLVAQACGLDLFLSSAPLQPFAAPVFSLACEPGHYYSYIVGDPQGPVAAVNSLTSHSGWTALLTRCVPKRAMLTGSHLASIRAVRSGEANVAAIDAVTWAILQRDAPAELRGLTVSGQSDPAPAPPFVTRPQAVPRELYGLLDRAVAAPEARAATGGLLIDGVLPVSRADYLPVQQAYARVRAARARVEILPAPLPDQEAALD